MTETSRIPDPSVDPAQNPAQNRAPNPGTRKAAEVRRPPAASQSRDSTETQQRLLRLNRILDRNQPLDTDVPRGFYLNIQV